MLFKKLELLEACRYGLVEQVHSFIKAGVNVNITDFVSGLSTLDVSAIVTVSTQLLSCIHIVTGCILLPTCKI